MPPTHVLDAEQIFRGQDTVVKRSDLTFHLPGEVGLVALAGLCSPFIHTYSQVGGRHYSHNLPSTGQRKWRGNCFTQEFSNTFLKGIFLQFYNSLFMVQTAPSLTICVFTAETV